MHKKILVISGINLIDGGAYSVYCDFLKSLIQDGYQETYEIIALVGSKKLFNEFKNHIKLIEFPRSKKNWIFRLYYEYIYFYKLSKRMNVDVWISMHDTTPNVVARKQFVYCHNPSPFNKMSLKDIKFGYKYYIFSKLYKYVYKINIHRNDAVIVQQDWMRKEFIKMYDLKADRVIVSRPNISSPQIKLGGERRTTDTIFLYPSYPRYFKNFEVVCSAALKLENKGITNFKLYLTIDGSENSYSKMLIKKFYKSKNIVFCGLQSREKIFEMYDLSSCMIFMSKLETWGMPISEYKGSHKPMILSDLPYAHEAIGSYDQVAFVNPNNSGALSDAMNEVIKSNRILTGSVEKKVSEPFARNWSDLLKKIL